MSKERPKKYNSKPKIKSPELEVMEGKYVIVGYEAEDDFETINTILIYKIVNGQAKAIFDVDDFPEYQQVYDPGLIDLISKKIKELQITEVYQLDNLHNENFQRVDSSNFFGIELGSGDTGKLNDKDEVEDWWEVSPWIVSDEVLRALSASGVKIKTYDVINKKILG